MTASTRVRRVVSLDEELGPTVCHEIAGLTRITHMEYKEDPEYKRDQEKFDAGELCFPDEIFRVAQRWGIEAKVKAITKLYGGHSRKEYLDTGAALHNYVWLRAGLSTPITALLTGKVLDLGCGIASFLEILPGVASAVAVDPALAAYAERIPDKTTLGQSGKCLYVNGIIQDITDKDFDAVYSYNAIDHGVDWEKIIEHCARVLKPGGHLLLGVHVADGPRTSYHRRLTHPCHFSIEELNTELQKYFKITWQSPTPDPRPFSWMSHTEVQGDCS